MVCNKQEARCQLFIFPFAGGSAKAFAEFGKCLRTDIDVVYMEYPGHGARSGEKAMNNFESIIEDAERYVKKKLDSSKEIVVFGYSMGCIVAYELLKNKAFGDRQVHTFFCAEASPYNTTDRQLNLSATDDEVLDRMVELGGLPARMRHNMRYIDIFMRVAIDDYKILKEFTCVPGTRKIKGNLTIIYCSKDTMFSEVERWQELFEGKTSFYEMGMNHFFINDHPQIMASVINSELNHILVKE